MTPADLEGYTAFQQTEASHVRRAIRSQNLLPVCVAERYRIKEQIGDVAGRVRTLINRASIEQERGDYLTALRSLDAAREVCERLSLAEPLAEVMSNSGVVQLLPGDLQAAATSFNAALEAALPNGCRRNHITQRIAASAHSWRPQ